MGFFFRKQLNNGRVGDTVAGLCVITKFLAKSPCGGLACTYTASVVQVQGI